MGEGKVVAVYQYKAADGSVIFEKERIEPGRDEKKKDFRTKRITDGGYEWGLLDSTPRVLFNLPKVLSSSDVYFTEGERDACTLESIGLVSTTTLDGANGKWIPEYTESLKGRTVYIVGDNDAPGLARVEQVYSEIKNHCTAHVIKIPNQWKDVSDFFENGGTTEEFNGLIEISRLPESHPVARLNRLIRRKGSLTAAESEKVVLGCVMSGKGLYSEIAQLNVEDFTSEANRIVYSTIKELDSQGPCDRPAVTQYLESIGKLEEVGGISALLDMTEDLPTAFILDQHVDIIAKKSSDRNLVASLCRNAESLVAGADPEKVKQNVIASINSVPGRFDTGDVSQVVDIVGDIEEFVKPLEPGIMCQPLQHLFDDIYGFRGGQLIVVGARPSVGKSSFMYLVTSYAASQGFNTEIYSFEVSKKECVAKIACMLAQVRFLDLIKGAVTESQLKRVYSLIRYVSSLPLGISDKKSAFSIPRLRTHLKQMQVIDNPVKFLAFDYVQLMVSDSKSDMQRNQAIGGITRGLKELALEFNIPILLLSQLNRESDRFAREPIMADLKESGDIEQDADVVMLLHRKVGEVGANYESEAKVLLKKQRVGPTGPYEVRFSEPFMMFYDPTCMKAPDYPALLEIPY